MTCVIGLSTKASEWNTTLKDVGPGVGARRIFGNLDSPGSLMTLAKQAVTAKMWPILSVKVPSNDWAGAAAGKYDSMFKELSKQLAALNSKVFIAVHHEPAKDGTASDWAKMQTHVLPILKNGNALIRTGVIGNGWWWSSKVNGYTDAEIAEWLPKSTLAVIDIVASDCYQGGSYTSPGEDGGVKMRNMQAWADRVGVLRLGVGEYNGFTAAGIKSAGDVALATGSKFRFACCWSSQTADAGSADLRLTGERLTAYKATLAAALK